MKYILVFATCLLCLATSEAQISLVEDGSVMAMIYRHKEINRSMTVDGWRVQIAAGTDRNAIMEAKSKFLTDYPELNAEWTYKAPYYKLNAGAFRTKLEATELKHRIEEQFPNAYIIKDDKIKASEFLRS